MATRKPHARTILVYAIVVLALALVPAALAGKGGNDGGKAGNNSAPTYEGTLSGPVLVVDTNGDGMPNAGDSITFNVSSTAAYPFVSLTCSRNGSQVVQQTLGFFGGWSRTFYLGGLVWTGGAADCVATLYSVSYSGTTEPTEATSSFSVGA